MTNDCVFNNEKSSNEVKSNESNNVKKSHKSDIVIIVDFDCEINKNFYLIFDCDDNNDSDFNLIFHCDKNCDIDNNNNDNSNLIYNRNKNCNIDDNYNTRSKETRSFLYQHYIISIIANSTPKKFNLVFMNVTLLYTKKKDNYSRT